MCRRKSSQPIKVNFIMPDTPEDRKELEKNIAKVMIEIAIKQFGEEKVDLAIRKMEEQQRLKKA